MAGETLDKRNLGRENHGTWLHPPLHPSPLTTILRRRAGAWEELLGIRPPLKHAQPILVNCALINVGEQRIFSISLRRADTSPNGTPTTLRLYTHARRDMRKQQSIFTIDAWQRDQDATKQETVRTTYFHPSSIHSSTPQKITSTDLAYSSFHSSYHQEIS